MKTLSIAGLLAGLAATASSAHADTANIQGSDTLFGVVTQAITKAGLDPDPADPTRGALHYVGGGSGTGENGLIAGTQGIAPMSRALTQAAINNLLGQGVTPVQHVIGLDGVSLFVNAGSTVVSLDIPTIRQIYLCNPNFADWSQVPSAGGKTGPIVVYARNGLSGTTDTFKTLIGGLPATTNGNANWGSCVHEVDTTDDIATHTSTEDGAIGFAGLSAGRPDNKALAVAVDSTTAAISPTTSTIRDFSYPLSRRLYVNSVADGRIPSDDEQSLLDQMLDRSFLDPILTANEFVTCGNLANGTPKRCP